MKKDDKIELAIAIICGIIAAFTLVFIKSLPAPVGGGLFSLSTTGCFFFALSFSQRHYRNGQET